VPSLYAWLRRNPRLVDGALALLLIYPGGSRLLVTLPFTLGMVVPIVFRRTYPVAAFAAVIVVGALQVLLLRRPIGADLSVLIVLYTLAACRPRRVSLRGLAICLVGAAVATWRWHPVHPVDGLYTVGVETALFGGPVLLAWLLGDSARWRRGYYQALEEKAARLERERDAQALVVAAAERARIAREIHDVVAHNVSVMVVQADGAAFAIDGSPQRAREALGAISATGRRALAEMRSLLGVLRDPAGRDVDLAAGPELGPSELGPQPGIDELGELLGQAREAGLPVSFTVSGVPRPVPEGEALAVYRVVQESLTNVRKHAGPGATAAVSLGYAGEGLVIRVADDGRGPGGAGPDGDGHGLTGMRERIELYGGSVRIGPRPGGGYEVVARLPLALEPA
jgi:signal transduction histidine kinase